MEGHSDHWNTYLSCIYRIWWDIPPQTTFPFVSCSLNPEPEPFITIRSSSDHSHSRPRPKAQYIIWALNPTFVFPQLLSLYLYFSLSFYFSVVVLWFMAKSFSFYCLLFYGFGDLVSFWGLMIWKNKGFWFWFGGVRKKGFLFQVLGVQKVGFLAWVWLCFCVGILALRVFYGWRCVCYVLCNACEVWTRVKSSHEHSTQRWRLLVQPWSFDHDSGVGGLCRALKLRPWKSWVWFRDEEIRWGEKRKRGREAYGLIFFVEKKKLVLVLSFVAPTMEVIGLI